MFAKRTLFVVGAGASAEFGFPVGSQLASTIAKKMDYQFVEGRRDSNFGDSEIIQQLQKEYPKDMDRFVKAANLIRDGVRLTNSIDDFLDIHAADEAANLLGKTAIVKSILEAERKSTLFFDKSNIYNTMDMGRVEATWIMKLFRTLGRGLRLPDIDKVFDNVAFIIFNYDRCVEQFIIHALRQVYNVPDAKAREIFKRLKIIHPYGSVGGIKTEQANSGIYFGGTFQGLSEGYVTLSSRIKTYGEQIEEGKDLSDIRAEVRRADKIIFLGFAFHDQNIKLLQPSEPLGFKEIYATAYDMSGSDVNVVRSELAAFFSDNAKSAVRARMEVNPTLKCAGLFDQYNKSLPS